MQIQPGIESLSTHVLQLMDKGSDSFQNLQLLRWGKELGIEIAWNLLSGFPGERDEDYDGIAALIPKVHHLQPPRGFGQVSVDRFSPMFNDPERFGITIEPFRAYRYVYPLPDEEIRNLAYAFSFRSARADTTDTMIPPPYARRAYNAYLIWKRFHPQVEFSFVVEPDGTVVVRDTRGIAVHREQRLSGLDALVFVALDTAQTVVSLRRTLAAEHAAAVSQDAIAEVVRRFDAWQWLHVEDGKAVVLANRVPEIAVAAAAHPARLLEVAGQ
jgi:hypothetical protein